VPANTDTIISLLFISLCIRVLKKPLELKFKYGNERFVGRIL